MNFRLKAGALMLCGALATGTFFTGCSKIDSNATAITIDDGKETISLGYYNFAARYQQAIYDMSYSSMMGETMWSQDLGGSAGTMENSVKTGISDMLEECYLNRIHAADYGIELTADDEANIEKAAAEFMDNNEKDTLKELGATDEYVREFLKDRFYSVKVREAIKNETKVSVSDDDAGQSTISYVLYSTKPTTDEETGEDVELTADEKAAEKEKADALADAADFDKVAEDSGAEVSTLSYTTKASSYEGESVPEAVIKEAKKLKDGEISKVVEVADEGYYVVRMDAKNDADATATERETLENEQRNDHYNEILEGWKSEVKWDLDKAQLENIKFDKMFEMSESMKNKASSEE